MLTKLAILLHGKLMAVAVAGVLVIGGGTAVTVAATTGAIPAFHGATAPATATHDANDNHSGNGGNGENATKTPTTGNENNDQNDDKNERKGVVSNLGTDSFTLTPSTGAAVTVTVSSQTQFHDLTGLADLKDGDTVEVQGTSQTDGTLAAADIERASDTGGTGDDGTGSGNDSNGTKGSEDARGTVVSVGGDSLVITVTGGEQSDGSDGGAKALVTGGQVTVSVSSTTTFKDLSGLGALKVGDRVEVKGAPQADGTLAASSVERGSGSGSGDGSSTSGTGA